MKRHVLSMSESPQKHIRACLSRTFFYGSDLEEEKLREALGRHAQCRGEDEIDPSVAAAGVKKALSARSEVTSLDSVEAVRDSLEEYFALNASIERVFRNSHCRLRSGPAHIITAELVVGLHPPEFKTKVATALDVTGAGRRTRISCTRSLEKRRRLGQLLSRPTSSAAFSLVRNVLSREWAVPRREKEQY